MDTSLKETLTRHGNTKRVCFVLSLSVSSTRYWVHRSSVGPLSSDVMTFLHTTALRPSWSSPKSGMQYGWSRVITKRISCQQEQEKIGHRGVFATRTFGNQHLRRRRLVCGSGPFVCRISGLPPPLTKGERALPTTLQAEAVMEER